MNKNVLRALAVFIAIAATSQSIYASISASQENRRTTVQAVSQRTQELLAKKQILEAQGQRLSLDEDIELMRGLNVLTKQMKAQFAEIDHESPGI